jgi:hypothetical protein
MVPINKQSQYLLPWDEAGWRIPVPAHGKKPPPLLLLSLGDAYDPDIFIRITQKYVV